MRPTLELTRGSQHRPGEPRRAGAVLICSAGQPRYDVLPLANEPMVFGREGPRDWLLADERVSRQHVRVQRVAGCWVVEDLGSRNGCYVDGKRLEGPQTLGRDLLLGLGHSLLWLKGDLGPHLDGEATMEDPEGMVAGGAMREALREIGRAARAGSTLLITGASGTGKELAARAYHRFTRDDARAPFVALNCATIPEGVAERLLFGAKRGAYSGATHDVEGYLSSAHGGTLFLDELAELDLTVQAKLLRVLETREVVPLGATQGKTVDVNICAATLRDVLARVDEGRFREDLYYRIGQPEVSLPPLSERLDELPWLITRAVRLATPTLRPTAALIEACALRSWPGNVRELMGELRRAAFAAIEAGGDSVRPSHLAAPARLLAVTEAPASSPPEANRPFPSDAEIDAALQEHDGNVTATARALGLHRNQLRRWLERRDSLPEA